MKHWSLILAAIALLVSCHVPQREQQIIETLTQNTPDTLSPYVARLYEEIFALSREYQKQLTEG